MFYLSKFFSWTNLSNGIDARSDTLLSGLVFLLLLRQLFCLFTKTSSLLAERERETFFLSFPVLFLFVGFQDKVEIAIRQTDVVRCCLLKTKERMEKM